LVTHHIGGYLKIAPEHTEEGPLNKMMKPGMGSYYRFKKMFERFSQEAGKKQYLIPYFISAHPGTEDMDMVNLALWLKSNNLKLDQVQNFIPSPLCNATTMYHTGKDPLKRIQRQGKEMVVPKGARQRRLHKALLRYHDPDNWPLIREALLKMGRRDLIGGGPKALVPPGATEQGRKQAPRGTASERNAQGPRGKGRPSASTKNGFSTSSPARPSGNRAKVAKPSQGRGGAKPKPKPRAH
ncbi:MAG TPA: DUF3362 domain-containing protein, partial [Motiliproteus sp.]